jgi:hypothetical protein
MQKENTGEIEGHKHDAKIDFSIEIHTRLQHRIKEVAALPPSFDYWKQR